MADKKEREYVCAYKYCLHHGQKVKASESVVINKKHYHWDCAGMKQEIKDCGDIDLDIAPSQRHLVYEHIIEKFGADKTAYVLAIGTISDKGTIDEIGRALNMPLGDVKQVKAQYSLFTDGITDCNDKIKKIESIDGYENNEKCLKDLEELRGKLEYNEKSLKDLKEKQYPKLP